jgi:Ca2+-binding RTX toxin-like protein
MMNGSKFSVGRIAWPMAVFFALLTALVSLQAVGAPGSAEAAPVGGGAAESPDVLCGVGLLPSGSALTWTGTAANDTKCGSIANDYMNGAGGDDRLLGTRGHDNLIGGPGNDNLGGDCGGCVNAAYDDTLVPGDGADRANGGPGNDTLVAYADGQPDTLVGSDGTDVLRVMSCHLDSADIISQIEIVSRTSC